MSIWFRPYTLEEARSGGVDTLAQHLGIEITEIGADSLTGTMPVDARTRQPFGVLHGGASAALAESLGSLGANLCVDQAKNMCVGQELNANHVRPVSDGFVRGVARPFHLGNRSHVWEILISDPKDKLVCIARLTMFVLDRPGGLFVRP